ncbi:hypothetical protein OCH239_10450 [Roseivivax halodurans JCM 10272]|uniref:HNH nuclease domain-containing protein n=1 Tax=Roseivivax halodurans JCM 10272 TaxID=1449350 RepID=X7EE72_9RHOB|nr:HNH endonuclease [Roseivivax halodurans]ETX13393.1 hypothetical protein OCH239_10450 [Roseivivax halodurans JCM 10272]
MDDALRAAAFSHVRGLVQRHGLITSEHLKAGFSFRGERVPLINPQRGIFKPRSMRHLLSIRTVFPKKGAKVWYDDQRRVHEQIYAGSETVDYAFMGDNPDAADNRWLREAYDNAIPIIYFLGVAPGHYQALTPVFVSGWNPSLLKADIVFGEEHTSSAPQDAVERRYGLRQVKQRLHQATFRAAVMSAYGGRCALSRLPVTRLLDAAHIMPDANEALGQPLVQNGLPMSKIHHSAFDSQLIGIDPDFRVHVSPQLMEENDGPVLEAMKELHGDLIHLPARSRDYPDRDRLAARFADFQAAF